MTDISTLNGIRKIGADFSFANTLLSNVNNKYFEERLLNADAQASRYPDNNLVNVLSAIGDQLGSRIYDEILNYIDNVGNVDVCKVKSLQTMTNMLGLTYTVFKVINDMPLEIQRIIDVMSITPEYLLMSNKMYNILTSFVYNNATSSISEEISNNIISSQLSGINAAYSYDDNKMSDISAKVPKYIDLDFLDKAISSLYSTQMSAILLSSYYDFELDGQPILSTNVISCNVPGYRTYTTYINNDHSIMFRSEEDEDSIAKMKRFYNLSFFNEVKAADEIELGDATLDQYTKHQQEIIEIELKRRSKAFNASSPLSRYAYYTTQHVQEYISFVENMYSVGKLSGFSLYDVDNDYILFKHNTAVQLLSAESEESPTQFVDCNMINNVAQQLTTITQYIRELRQKIKSQAQKNSMKGTFIFLNYIVNEYLKESMLINKQYFSDDIDTTNVQADVQLIEYIDPVNYFNISTDVDTENVSYLEANKSSLNERYWQQDGSIPYAVPPDNTNIFTGMNIIKSRNAAFSQEAISAFYIDTLNNLLGDTSTSCATSVHLSHLDNFLCALFDFGADRTYKDANGNLCCFITDDRQYLIEKEKLEKQKTSAEEKMNADIADYSATIENKKSNISTDIELSINNKYNELLDYYNDVSANLNEKAKNYQTLYDNGQLLAAVGIDESKIWSEDEKIQLSSSTLNQLISLIAAEQVAKYNNMQSQLATYEAQMSKLSVEQYAELDAELDEYILEKEEEFNNISAGIDAQIEEVKEKSISAFKDYKKELYYRYTGLSSSDLPFYYYSNKIHPSYQVHPYLSTFIETYDYTYMIENMPVLQERTMFNLLTQNVNSYIDQYGYLISVWNNPLNRNSDYLTHYERVNHIDYNYQINALLGYDGLFYPPAANDLLSIYNNFEPGRFEKNLQKFVERWYDGLNVSEIQAAHIVQQLSGFEDQISAAATKCYDIYRYGKDVYGNMYILLKDYGIDNVSAELMQDVPEELKRTTNGSLWIRLKNHPIAIPAYALGELSSLQQIDYDADMSNTALMNSDISVDNDSILNGKIPPIYDFFMSKDKQQTEIYAKTKVWKVSDGNENGSYEEINAVLIARILQQYNYNKDIDRFQLFLTSVKQKSSEKTELQQLQNNEYFIDFINYDYNIGFVSMLSTSAADNKINVTARQKLFVDPDIESYINDVVKCENIIEGFNNNLSDIKVDVCNQEMYFAYISNYNSNDQIVGTMYNSADAIKNTTTYCSLSSCEIDIFNDNIVVVDQAEIGKYQISKVSRKYYLPYTNMGFIPAIGMTLLNDDYNTSDMSKTTTVLMKKHDVMKMQIVAPPDDIEKSIKYIYCLPYARILEGMQDYELRYLSSFGEEYEFIGGNSISVYCYNTLLASESGEDDSSERDLEKLLYSPEDVRNYLVEHKDENIKLKLQVDEEYARIQSLLSNNYATLQIPWLVKGDVPPNFLNPGYQTDETSAQVSNMSIFKLVESDSYAISVSWYRYGENGQIKLDFNAPYYNKQINQSEKLKNFHNYQNTFLNLDYPGAAGFLKIYNNNIQQISEPYEFNLSSYYDNVYYIKNISDTKPKFIISALNYEKYIPATLLNTEDNIVDPWGESDTISCVPLIVDVSEEYDEETGTPISVCTALNIEKLL